MMMMMMINDDDDDDDDVNDDNDGHHCSLLTCSFQTYCHPLHHHQRIHLF